MTRPAKGSRKRITPSRKQREEPDLPRWRRLIALPIVRFTVVLLLSAACGALIIAALVLFHYDRQAARYDIEAVGRMPMESTVTDATGALVGYLHGENVGSPLPLDRIPPHFLDALVAREDSRFYQHHGIDHRGLMRAWLRNFREKRTVQGGSTLTMQLTRMTFGLTGRTMQRKLLEMAIARRIEKRYTKEEILLHYVNRVFLGTGMNGLEQAARGYFGKDASELTLPEAAMIAGVIRAPNGFSPFRHYDAALREMRGTLGRMVDEGFLEEDEAAALLDERPAVLPQERWLEMLRREAKISEQSYVLRMVEEEVRARFPSLAGVGGLAIRTTFDLRLQEAAERAVAARLTEIEGRPGYPHPLQKAHRVGDPRYLQAATVVLENYTGAIRALVGGRDFAQSEFNRAIRARRPMGSVFKPLVYGTAFERGLFPGMLVSDAAIAPGEIAWDPTGWNPQNADGAYGGLLPVEMGLIQSRNTMTARVGEWAGIDSVIAMMEHAGLGEAERAGPTPPVYIGTVGANVRDVTSAYTVFATGGVRHETFFIESVTDRDGTILFQHADANYRVLSPGAAWLTSKVLKKVVAGGGTGAGLRDLGFTPPAGGKTGTTNDFEDAWFVGYASRLSCGVWIGLDQPRKIMDEAYGGRIAVPVWFDIMTAASGFGYEFGEFTDQGEVVRMELCRESGLLVGEGCKAAGTVYIEEVPHDLIPRRSCRSH
ncbi:MAG: transglycosylase domain-containing protein [Verrucomicrobia bacterium]|nr:transglycosylase domain-containing protein [Verrucomicrobiota bacterium]